ncbi:MAG: DUF4912 domain-containing protein [Candidatus Omnitrophica bacterium]|nr:DUF4912 domain-containing protein [Candidatus Omnitrophota bacterium]
MLKKMRSLKDKLTKKKEAKSTVSEKKKNVRRPTIKKAPTFFDESTTSSTVIGAQETKIEQTKFSHPEAIKAPKAMPQELPQSYNSDRIILQVRDPWWLHCYWEITQNTWNKLINKLKELFFSAKKVLRVYDISHINFDGTNAHRYFDIEVREEANNWYIDTAAPGRSWVVDYGLRLPSGEFITIVRSNVVSTPIDGPSWITDEEWMVPEEMFGRLYGMGFGFGNTSPGKGWQERLKQALFSGVLASPGITSAASPVRKPQKERAFWLVVDCELIVYGATEPDATVTVQGKPIKLRPDGTFTLRYYLPDGKQVIAVKAVSSDKVEERTITPIVTRQTTQENIVNKEEETRFFANT